METLKKHRERIALGAILLLAGFLSIWGIWKSGYGNEFYAACVKSMLTSFKNFFFVSLDSEGFVTVDKPPVSLWIQAIFAKVFGFHGWTIIVPQGLAAVASVWLLHRTVKRHFGEGAALISALALALSPIFIAVSRTNNTDSILIFFMVLSAWAMMLAADKGSFKWLSLSAVFLGIAYNAKTLQAFLILPALFAGYFFTAPTTWRKRILHMSAAALILIAVSLSWSLIVDLTPADRRPYVDNSSSNSELELALNYNGLQRLTGMLRGGARTSDEGAGAGFEGYLGAGMGQNSAQGTQRGDATADAPGDRTSSRDGDAAAAPQNMPDDGNAGAAPRAGGNSMFSHGSQSLLRMFNSDLGGQDSWLLSFGLFAIIILLLMASKKREPEHEKRMIYVRNAIIWGGSVLTMVIWFSVAQFYHEYYIATMAPFLAALVGIGLKQLWTFYRAEGKAWLLLPLAFAITIATQAIMLAYWPRYAQILIPALLVLSGLSIAALCAARLLRKTLPRKIPEALMSLAVAGILLTPAVWSGYSLFGRVNAMIPTAGPSASGFGGAMNRTSAPQTGTRGGTERELPKGGAFPSGQGGAQEGGASAGSGAPTGGASPGSGAPTGGGNLNGTSSGMINYLLSNYKGEKWLVAVPNSNTAASIILATDKAVMSVGGFGGGTKILTLSSLQEMVKNRELRYFLISGASMGGDEVAAWVRQNGKVVAPSEYGGSSSGIAGGTLYDLYA